MIDKARVWLIKFRLLFHKEPYGIAYKGIVYLNKKAIKVFENSR